MSAWKFGYCDGIMGRECHSPWHDFRNNSQYLKGFMDGTSQKPEPFFLNQSDNQAPIQRDELV